MLYLTVAFGAFMSYIFSPTFDDARARVVLNRLVFGTKDQRNVELILLFLVVFGGAGLAYLIMEPSTPKLAVTVGLGCTSVATTARTALSKDAPLPPTLQT